MDELKPIIQWSPIVKYESLIVWVYEGPGTFYLVKLPLSHSVLLQTFNMVFFANIPPALVQKNVYLPPVYVCMFI